MTEPVDVYCDQFQINLGVSGCACNFSLSSAVPPAPGVPPQAERVATIRMSLEHLKLMTFLLHRQLVQYETQAGVSVPIPVPVLGSLQIRQEDWQAFWQS
ncbi:MAG: hypothetical protein ACREIS_04430 [Nitrospiraceae bacterium]